MSTDLLLKILIIVATVAAISLIVVLWRYYQVLTNLKDVTAVAKKRAKDIDDWIDKIEKSIGNMTETVKGIVTSLESLKIIKDNIVNIIKDKTKEKGKK